MSLIIGYGKSISHVIIGLKTVKGTKQLKLDPTIYESLQKEKVQIGDVIYIEANTGSVKVSYFNYLNEQKLLKNIRVLRMTRRIPWENFFHQNDLNHVQTCPKIIFINGCFYFLN